MTLPSEDDVAFDAAVSAAYGAAKSAVEAYCSRKFGPGTRTEAGMATVPFIVPGCTPLATVTSLTIEGVEVAPRIMMGGLAIGRADKRPIVGDWVITYATTEDVPADVLEAISMTARAIANAPALDGNLTSVSLPGGVLSAGFQPYGAGSLPLGARSLLDPHIRRFCP